MKRIVWSIAIVVVMMGSLELVSRFWLGLGDPPLSIADSKIEYLFAPNQDCRRFGHRILYNDCSMRNDYDIVDVSKDDVRVLLLGDSVLNGGALTDHVDLATTIAERDLRAMGCPIRILNISAGSWGPVNCAEYVKRFGVFGAESIYMVLNAGDLWDVPDYYEPVVGTRSFPDRKPICAAWEFIGRYVVPRVFGSRKISRLESGIGLVRGGLPKEEAEERCLDAIEYCLGQAKKGGIIYTRLRTDWGKDKESESETKLKSYCLRRGIGFYLLSLDPTVDYRDIIHINEHGQRKLADLVKKLIMVDGVVSLSSNVEPTLTSR